MDQKDIQSMIAAKTAGGKVTLAAGEYPIASPVEISASSLFFEGESWCYAEDPNGVFEGHNGVKLKLKDKTSCAIRAAGRPVLGGALFQNFGIQGDIPGMDTRGFFDYAHPEKGAGISLTEGRYDQSEFRKISAAGLASAISVSGKAEIDACRFHGINTDGCGVGLYFCPEKTYYARVEDNVFADNPEYGFYAAGTSGRFMIVQGNSFVRNGGAFGENVPSDARYAVFIKGFRHCQIENNVIDFAGTFWYYNDDAKANTERQPSFQSTASLYVEGDDNLIHGNVILHGQGNALVLKGNGNVISGGIYDKDIVISGDGNTVNGCVLKKGAKIVIAKGSVGTRVTGVLREDVLADDAITWL